MAVSAIVITIAVPQPSFFSSSPPPRLSSSFHPSSPRLLSPFKLASSHTTPGRRRSQYRKQSLFFCSLKKLSDIEPFDLSSQTADLSSLPTSPGIYAVFDKEGELQFVGLSRRVSSSIQAHVQELPQFCGSAKIAVVDAQEKAALTEAWKQWVQEYVETTGKVPPGNMPGVTTWTAKKPRRDKPDLKLTPGRHVTLTIPLEQLIDKVVKENKAVVFIKGSRTAPQCGFSHKVLTILNENGVDYESINVLDEEHNSGLKEALKAYSQWPTFPQVFANGEFVGGADILEEIAGSGNIKALFQKTS